jgi:hypothetical protein
MRKTVCTAKPATSRIRRKTLPGAHRKAAEGQTTPICEPGRALSRLGALADQWTYERFTRRNASRRAKGGFGLKRLSPDPAPPKGESLRSRLGEGGPQRDAQWQFARTSPGHRLLVPEKIAAPTVGVRFEKSTGSALRGLLQSVDLLLHRNKSRGEHGCSQMGDVLAVKDCGVDAILDQPLL